jgi:ABC-type lipoprotein release transport system permease subunit
MFQDIRHALRVMWKDASITAAAIAILALGIGATTTVFSLVNGILVRPLPYPQPQHLVHVAEFHGSTEFGNAVAFPNYQDIRARTRLLHDIGRYSIEPARSLLDRISHHAVAMSAVAAFIPARRAPRVEPVIALREE